MTAPPSAALAAAREIRALLGLSGSHDSEVAAVISRHCSAPANAGGLIAAAKAIDNAGMNVHEMPDLLVKLRDALAAGDAGGEFVVVPREPTDAMLHASWLQSGESYEMADRYYARMREHWRAMLAAADAGGWRPMSEAPANQKVLFAFDPEFVGDDEHKIGMMMEFGGRLLPVCRGTIYSTSAHRFKGWQPLPSPPPAARPRSGRGRRG